VNKAWIRCVDDALVRADAVVTLRNGVDGLTAETLTGCVVQLTRTDCPSTVQLALLEEIRSAENADDHFTKVIIAVEGQGRLAWRHESVDTLIDLGQVLRYAHLLSAHYQVKPVLAIERQPTDESWQALCDQLGVLLVWPPTFGPSGVP